jgi:hypothetical protein
VLWQHVFQAVVCVPSAVQSAFVGEKDFNIIKMCGTTIKIFTKDVILSDKYILSLSAAILIYVWAGA